MIDLDPLNINISLIVAILISIINSDVMALKLNNLVYQCRMKLELFSTSYFISKSYFPTVNNYFAHDEMVLLNLVIPTHR